MRLGVNEKSEFGKILTNPQLLNTYSYAGNNPVVNTDDNGELSIKAALLSPFTAIPAAITLSQIAKFGGERYNIPVSERLLSHSLSLNPQDQNAGEGSDVVDLIQNSEQFQNKLSTEISGLEESGIDWAFTNIDLRFKPGEGDAYSALSRIDLVVQGAQNENGSWDLSLTGTDPYDYGFDFSDYGVDKFGIGANVLSGAQKAGVLSPFDTHVDFKEKNYTPKKEKKNEKK